jgi:uncharacterized protein (DUF342 family)
MGFLSNINIESSLKWLIWKISPESTYLTVVPEFIPQKWDINEIKVILLKNKVINFDIAKIEIAIKNASGQMEAIGPSFELFDENKREYLNLHVTPMQVSFSIDSAILKTNYNITESDISFILAEKAVVYGINFDTIRKIVLNEVYGREFIIASATPPVAGQNAVINEILTIDLDAKPFIKEDGTVDYKRWDNIRQIKKGDIICTRIPPTPGIPGISVFGAPLSPDPGEDYALPGGVNTQTIDNETKLVASINGFLYRQGRNICVDSAYIVKGDVNFRTGNIEYSGDVVVRGNVNVGFSVTADGNISIEGIVEAANIKSKKGNIFLKGSVFGQNKTHIIAGKNIIANNIQDSKIIAGQTLNVRKQIRGCHIETENLEMPEEAQIISSSVFFKGHAKCGKIGGKIESINEFIFVNHEKEIFKEELQRVNVLLKKLIDAIKILQTKLLSIPSVNITSELENQKKIFASQLTTCVSSKEQLTTRREKLLKLIEFMPDKDALISTYSLYPVLRVSIFDSNKEYKHDLSKLQISWKNGAIKMEPI